MRAHLETSVKRRQLSRVDRGSTGAHAATVALMQECQNISQKMSSHDSSDTAECPRVTASAQPQQRSLSRPYCLVYCTSQVALYTVL